MKNHVLRYMIAGAWLLLLALCLQPVYAGGDYLFRQLSTPQGVPSYVQSVHAEKYGFIWAGTPKGLVRFDGYEVRFYDCQPDDEQSLPGNEVYQVIEDSLQQIWVLTSGGLAVYNRKSDNFRSISDTHGDPVRASAACLTEGGIQFATRNCLYRYEYEDRSFRRLADYPNSASSIKEIHPWEPGVFLCVKRWGGLWKLDVRSGMMTPVPIRRGGQVTCALPDSKGRLWVTAYNEGVACFDRQGWMLQSYTTRNSDLSHNVVLCMRECDGLIWMGTDGGGINILNPDTGEITVLPHRSGDSNSLPDNSIRCLCTDDVDDNIWAGSVKGGLVNIRSSFICFYADVPLNSPGGLTERSVKSFCQEAGTDEVWIGTDGGGINRFNVRTRRFTHYPETWREKVISICPYTSRELLVSLFSKGVFAFDKQAGTLRRVADINRVVDREALYSRKPVNLYRESSSSLLLLSTSLYRYDLSTRQDKCLSAERLQVEGVLSPVGGDGVYSYFYDMRHLYRLPLLGDSVQTLYTAPPAAHIQAACSDGKGRFWIGTTEGLNLYDPATGTDVAWERGRLKNVLALLSDRQSRLWIGTDERLFVWLPAQQKLVLLDESDGVQANEYMGRSVLNASQGHVFLGGINGLVYVDAHLTGGGETVMPTLVLTDISCEGRSLLAAVDEQTLELRLETSDRPVTVQVMAREGNRFRKHTYYWQIEGGAGRQVAESEVPEMTFPALVPGTYRIGVSCSTPDNRRTEVQTLVALVVPPAWYQTWWFMLLCAFGVAVGVVYGVWHAVRRKGEKMELALQEHKQQVYEEKVRFLININHELRTPLTLIHAPLTQILHRLSPEDAIYPALKNVLKQSRRMKELLNMVLNLRKMEMKEIRLQMRPYPLNDWMKETADDFLWEGRERNIELVYDFDPAVGEVCFDSDKHVIILTNLLVNAFKHSPMGGVITLRTELVADGAAVRVSVIDQGEGLKEVDLSRLFTRFYQGDDAKEGAGIGLSYAKILVEEHHGEISAYNNAGGGACFWYELPVKQENATVVCQPREYLNTLMQPQDADARQPEVRVTETVDLRRYVCLFVDDSCDLRDMVAETFKGCFKKLLVASGGQEALELARREMPDVLISDLMMPGMDGFELCRRVKEDDMLAYMQVILLTARTDDGSKVDGYRTGADAYVEKPFEPESLLETVRNRLFQRERIKAHYAPAPVADKVVNTADDVFLHRVNRLIADNMEREDLDIAFLCGQLGTSRATLFNKVKALTGMGAGNYITRLRMEKAAELLRQTSLSMTEIAERTGFSSSRYFSTTFKKYMGVTPTQYKNGDADA